MELCLASSRGKTHDENFGGSKLGFSPFSQVCIIVFLDIAQDCSMGQSLTFHRAETSKKKKKKKKKRGFPVFSFLLF